MSNDSTWSLHSRAVHAGRNRQQLAHTTPIDLSTTARIPQLEEAISSIDHLNLGGGQPANPIYSRLHNSTVSAFEQGLAELEGAEAAVAFASGMAAITALLLAAKQAHCGKGHIVAVRTLYGGTDSLLSSNLLDLPVTWLQAGASIRPHIRSETALIWLESPANPTCELVDIRQVVREAGNIPVAVDSTFATPVLQQPLDLGASYALHSATKFIGGHSDVLAGVIACSEQRARPLRKIRIQTGANLHPLAAYLLHRGLQTLPLRVERAQQNATHLASKLSQHPAVKAVYHPSLPSCDPLQLVGRQQSGPGALLAFEVNGGLSAASKVMSEVRLCTPAVSLGSVDTLIQHPAGLTHRNASPEARALSGISEGLLRVSVGIENQDDLWRDLQQALSASL